MSLINQDEVIGAWLYQKITMTHIKYGQTLVLKILNLQILCKYCAYVCNKLIIIKWLFGCIENMFENVF